MVLSKHQTGHMDQGNGSQSPGINLCMCVRLDIDNGKHAMGERGPLQQVVLGTLDLHMQMNCSPSPLSWVSFRQSRILMTCHSPMELQMVEQDSLFKVPPAPGRRGWGSLVSNRPDKAGSGACSRTTSGRRWVG